MAAGGQSCEEAMQEMARWSRVKVTVAWCRLVVVEIGGSGWIRKIFRA